MPLNQGVVDRLLLAKSLLAGIRFHPPAEPHRNDLAKHIISAHDAAELALAAIISQIEADRPRGNLYLMDYFEVIRQARHKEREVDLPPEN